MMESILAALAFVGIVLLFLAISGAFTVILTLIAQYAIGDLWHPVPFWPLFALIFVLSCLVRAAGSRSK